MGYIAENSGGFWGTMGRLFLRSHRPMEIHVWNKQKQKILTLKRPFFWFFSDLTVADSEGKILGHVYRKFGILYKKYELCDERGKLFARIVSPLWKLWTFPVFDSTDAAMERW